MTHPAIVRSSATPATGRPSALRLGYLVKAFPRISETFIINEILQLERQGFHLQIYAMNRPSDSKRHRLVDEVTSPMTCLPESLFRALPSVMADHLWALRRFPLGYISALLHVATAGDLGLFRRFIQAACVARLLDRDRIDHLHVGFVHAPGSVAWLVHLMTGMPYSVATHAKDLYHSRPRLLRRKLSAARLVLTCTRQNVTHLKRVCRGVDLAQLRQVYHGTDLQCFTFGPCGLANPPLVLAVARLVEKKGLDDLVRACRVLRDRGRVFRCRIVGAGILRSRLEGLIGELGLETIVSLEGEADRDEVRAWYRQATVLVAPSLVTGDGDRDGIPNVLAEAAACGLPVVSTTVSAIPELVKHGKTGLLVPPANPVVLADAIDELVQSPRLRERLRTNARALVEEKFDLRSNALKIGDELRRVMLAGSRRKELAAIRQAVRT